MYVWMINLGVIINTLQAYNVTSVRHVLAQVVATLMRLGFIRMTGTLIVS